MTENLTRRQEQLIQELRHVEQDIASLRRRKMNIVAELDRIYPNARKLVYPPKDRGTVITVFNYEREGYSAQITATAKGRKAITDMDPILRPVDAVMLALVSPRPQGADLSKLLVVPQVTEYTDHKTRINKLVEFGYFNIEFTKE